MSFSGGYVIVDVNIDEDAKDPVNDIKIYNTFNTAIESQKPILVRGLHATNTKYIPIWTVAYKTESSDIMFSGVNKIGRITKAGVITFE